MKNTLLKATLAAALLAPSFSMQAQTMFGLTDSNQIFTMSDINSPSNTSGPYSISGVTSGQTLVALDARPDGGGLYALGYNATTGQAQLYRISGSGSSYTATAVNSTATNLSLGSGNSVGFDFISTMSNQIRVTSTNGNSYVMNADDGSIMSNGANNISYATGDINALASASVGATSYTNSYYGSDATDEIGYDLATNSLVRFDNANYYNNSNNNYPTTIHTIGLSGIITASANAVGMDSWYDTATHTNSIWISATTLLGSNAHLYKMNNNNGVAQDMGVIGSGSFNVKDIAFGIDRDSSSANSTVQGQLMAALTLNLRNLIFFDSYRPDYIRRVVHLNGMTSGQAMLAIAYGMDQRLYGLGYNGSNQTYQLYTIDSATGHVTAVNNTAYPLDLGPDNSTYGNGGNTNVAFNFIGNANNRIRVIGNNGMTNVQLNSMTGVVAEVDSSMQYGSGDVNFGQTVDLGSIGYTNSYNNSDSSMMIGYDFNTGAMVSLNASDSSNNGNGFNNLNTALNLTSVLNIFNNSSNNTYRNGYLDVVYDNTTHSNLGFMASNYYGNGTGTDNYSTFYTMHNVGSATTTPTSAGSIGSGTPVKSMAARKTYVPSAVNNIVANGTGSNLFVYPNPAISNTRIVLPEAATGKVFVDMIDMNGRVVRSYEFGLGTYQLDLDLSNIPTGLYSARVMQDGAQTQSVKIMKQ